jgi:hypothetical protein
MCKTTIRYDVSYYLIDRYVFWNTAEGFRAIEARDFDGYLKPFIIGRPALDLLTGALCRAIEARGWCPGVVLHDSGSWSAQCKTSKSANIYEDFDEPHEALLAALLAALEAE